MSTGVQHLKTSPRGQAAGILALWLGLFAVLLSLLPDRVTNPADSAFIISIGLIGAWRWAWGGFHMLRAFTYTRLLFPKIRRAAEADPTLTGRHVAAVVLSWKMGDAMNAAVYGNLFRDMLDYCGTSGGTVLASVSSSQDIAIIRHVHAGIDPTGRIRLAFTLQDGSGKRAAMADALATLRNLGIPPDCPAILMDGDTLVRPGTIRTCAPILLHQKGMGALTLDNTPLVAGRTLDREWYRLRMAQRHVYMSSMALSARVLVLTGRWSMYRSQILTDPSFAATILDDVIHHPRLGRIKMLTGDDKSTWRWVVEQGWDVSYVPDASIYCLESLPGKGFVKDTVGLQKRWFGNMVRGGFKARRLGARRLGLFTWLALHDQQVSMWTPLFGLIFFGTAAALHDPVFLLVYLLWIALTRTVHSLLTGLLARRWHPLFPMLTYYGQIVGALIKIFVAHNPNVQKWTRQNTGSATSDGAALVRADSRLLMAGSFVAFAAAVILFSNVTVQTARFDLGNDNLAMELIHGY